MYWQCLGQFQAGFWWQDLTRKYQASFKTIRQQYQKLLYFLQIKTAKFIIKYTYLYGQNRPGSDHQAWANTAGLQDQAQLSSEKCLHSLINVHEILTIPSLSSGLVWLASSATADACSLQPYDFTSC